jgi:cytidine deaminase
MNKQTEQQLVREAAAAMRNAYAPYSRFRVGAALLAANGRIFKGCNMENASYGLTICAERSAFAAAIAAGARKFKGLAVVVKGKKPAYPCGACLQVMAEFCGAEFPVLLAGTANMRQAVRFRLGDLLPRRFGGRSKG